MKKFVVVRTEGKCRVEDGHHIVECTATDRIILQSNEKVIVNTETVYNFEQGYWYYDKCIDRKMAKNQYGLK